MSRPEVGEHMGDVPPYSLKTLVYWQQKKLPSLKPWEFATAVGCCGISFTTQLSLWDQPWPLVFVGSSYLIAILSSLSRVLLFLKRH
jgi:hypothetical protein